MNQTRTQTPTPMHGTETLDTGMSTELYWVEMANKNKGLFPTRCISNIEHIIASAIDYSVSKTTTTIYYFISTTEIPFQKQKKNSVSTS